MLDVPSSRHGALLPVFGSVLIVLLTSGSGDCRREEVLDEGLERRPAGCDDAQFELDESAHLQRLMEHLIGIFGECHLVDSLRDSSRRCTVVD